MSVAADGVAGDATTQYPGTAGSRGRVLGVLRVRGMVTVRGMVRVLVAAIAVFVLVLLVPRPNSVPQPGPDVARVARSARAALDFEPAVPQGLPAGWTVTMAAVMHDTEGTLAWRVGYRSADGQYLGFVQARKPPLEWENRQVISGPTAGTVHLDGNAWLVRLRVDRKLTNYVLRGTDVETIVFGHAGAPDIETLARSLRLPPGQG